MKGFKFYLQRFAVITNDKTNQIITGGNDADTINNSGNFTKISLGGGDDSIYNTGNLVTISAGGGENKIYNSGEDAYIVTGNAIDSITNYGKNATIKVGDGDDSVRNGGSNSLINLGEGDNYAYNGDYVSYVTITAGSGNDTIGNVGHNANIFTGDGNDNVYNHFGSNTLIQTGNGNDTINSVDGYYGNSNNATINAGNGDDYIVLNRAYYPSSHFIQYAYGEGDDTIKKFSANDTLQIATGGHEFTTMKSGNDMYFIFDKGSITLQNVGNVSLSNFVITGGNSTPSTPEPVTFENGGGGNTQTNVHIHITNRPVGEYPYRQPMTFESGDTSTSSTFESDDFSILDSLVDFVVDFFDGTGEIIQDFVTDSNSKSNATSSSSIRRTNNLNAENGTSLQVSNSSSVNETIQYPTGDKNISLAKVSYSEQNNSSTHEDSVNFYSDENYTDVLNLTNYQTSQYPHRCQQESLPEVLGL